MKTTTMGAVAVSLMMLAWAAPAGVMAEENEATLTDEDLAKMPIDEYVVHMLEENGVEEMPDTAEVRVNGQGDFQEIPFEDALDMMLKHETKDTTIPLSSGPDVGASAGTTPSSCHPAIIYNVIAFGGFGADITVNHAGDAVTNTPDCDFSALQQHGGAGTTNVDVTDSGAITAAIANAAPGFAAHGDIALGFSSATGTTADCTAVLEYAFFFLYVQQVGDGMPGCNTDAVSATSVLEY